MKYKNLPEGWSYEGPDPSVGIFGEEWFHDDCKMVNGPGNAECQGVTVNEIQGLPDDHGLAVVSRQLCCVDCGEKVSFVFVEFVGVELPLDEVESVG